MWGLFDNIKTLPRIENRQRFCFFQCKISYLCNMGNTSDNQLILFHCPTIEKAGNRRRTRSLPRSGDGNITSRADRIAKRNRLLTARYYYWTELERRRFDDVLKILADNEFFVEDRTPYDQQRPGRRGRVLQQADPSTYDQTPVASDVSRVRLGLIHKLRFVDHPEYFQSVRPILR